jgi:hydrogenase maturation protein HypF
MTTSMGRLFDAVAALCGLRTTINYEGQAAIELEAACDPHERGRYPIELDPADGVLVIDPRSLIGGVCADVAAGVPVGVIASRFHAAVAAVTVDACSSLADANHTELVVLSGGVFLNRRLLESVCAGLDERGLRVLTPERLPIGDGGISYGQAAVAARRMAAA